MKNIFLPQWIEENKEIWNIICRIDDRRFTLEEAKKLIKEMKELANNVISCNNEFSTIFTLLITQYYLCESVYSEFKQNEVKKFEKHKEP